MTETTSTVDGVSNTLSGTVDKVRYAVVGAGWIAQESFMPGVHGTDNSVMTAIVTGSPDKAAQLAAFHGIEKVYSYEQYDEMLQAGIVDAVYIGLPNSLHAEYAIRAARAGVHVLVEKPLATTIADSEAMIAAARENQVWLMTAYRLHCEPGNMAVLDMIRRGEIGDPRHFSSHFSFQLPADNHRLLADHWGGPLQDVGVYCINAVRHVFADEPVEVFAMSSSLPGDSRFVEVDDSFVVTLRFPQGRLASFFASFGAFTTDSYTIVGTRARIEVDRGYRFEASRRVRLVRDDTPHETITETRFPLVDDFAGQTAYFSDCILHDRRPEPDGEEGLADMRVMLAIEESVRTGRPQPVQSPGRPGHPGSDTLRSIPRNDRRLVL